MPELSIITVCMNIQPLIALTCESVAAQTYPDVEWIVVDGGSNDGTVEILRSYEKHIARLISEPDAGIYNAMNKGIRAASGKWLLFLNGGDMLAAPDVLEKIFSRPHDDADIVYGDTLLGRNGAAYKEWKTRRVEDVGKTFFLMDNINHQSAFIRRELFDRYGLYDEGYKICADYEKWMVFAANNSRFKKEDIFVALYDMGGLSSADAAYKLLVEERKRIRQTHFSPQELRWAQRNRYTTLSRHGALPGGASLFSVQESRDGRKRRYCLLGLPLLKIRYDDDARSSFRAYLFSAIPLPGALFGRRVPGAKERPPGAEKPEGRE